jgi:predicted dehydrogenase
MFRLGIIGSDNSHAETFSKLANLGELDGGHYDDVRVTHICGDDPARTREVAEAGNIAHVVAKAEDMIGKIDGVLCLRRHGGTHAADTLPFLQAGIPAFVDKPLALTLEDATRILDAAEHAGVGFTSFSTLRFAEPVIVFIAEATDVAGDLTSGMCTGPANLNSEYGGPFFSGIHAVELMNTVWGYGCQSVSAVEHAGNVVAACRFDSGALVALNLLGNAASTFHLSAFGKDGFLSRHIDATSGHIPGLRVIIDTLRLNEWPLTREQLLEPMKILTALVRSLKEGREVRLDQA